MQAGRTSAAALDAVDERLDALAADGPEIAAQHLATLGFRFQSEDRPDLAARAYGMAARVTRARTLPYRLAAIRAAIVDRFRRRAFDGVEKLLREAGEVMAAGRDRPHQEPSLVRLAWDHELAGDAESAVRGYLLARIARDELGEPSTTVDGDTLERKLGNLRILQLNALAGEGRYEEACALHERTRHVLGLGPLRVYDIVSARQAAAQGKGAYRELLGPRRMAEPEIAFFGGPVALTSECGVLDAPPQYLASFEDCLAFPRSNLVLQGSRLIYDLAAHPLGGIADIKDGVNPDQVMMAVHGADRALVEEPAETQTLDAGLMLFGLQSKNYGHWLLEFVPRMLCFNDPACPRDVPICIDDHMPASHRQIVELLDERGRTVLPLPPKPARFSELHVAPVPIFFPFDIRAGLPVYDAVWPKDVLSAMRRAVLAKIEARGGALRQRGRRIFLSRRAFAQRQMVNEAEVARALTTLGFEIVYPENLTFTEQIETFHAADVIVGSASSALTNCIFCNEGARVVALIHANRSFNFRGYASMICSSGAKLVFLRGTTVEGENVHPFHANYTIDVARLKELLRQI